MGGRPWSVLLWDQSKLDGIDFIPQQSLLLSTDESFYILFYKKKEGITTLLYVNDYFYRKEMIMTIKNFIDDLTFFLSNSYRSFTSTPKKVLQRILSKSEKIWIKTLETLHPRSSNQELDPE